MRYWTGQTPGTQTGINTNASMKKSAICALLCTIAIGLVSCDEDGQTTTVSKSLFSNDTIVSHSNSNGSFTRTQYSRDFWGNRQTEVSRGHSNATQQGDLMEMGLKIGAAVLSEYCK